MSTPYGPVADRAFGPLLLNTDIDAAIIARLKQWFPTYLKHYEEERDLTVGKLQRPKDESFASTLEDDEFPDHILPAILVTSASTEGEPQKDADLNYYASWNVVVSCIVRGRTPIEAREIAAGFEGCARQILVQQPLGLDGEIRWTGCNVARVRDQTPGGNRFLAAGISTFLVYADKVVQEGAGPFIPDPDAPGPYTPPGPSEDDTYESPVQVTRVPVEISGHTPAQHIGEEQ